MPHPFFNRLLLYHSGANLVVSPSVSGGRLMAASVRQRAVPRFLEDLLSFGQGVDAAERVVRSEEAGRTVNNLPDLAGMLILGVSRGSERFYYNQCANLPLEAGDIVVYLVAGPAMNNRHPSP